MKTGKEDLEVSLLIDDMIPPMYKIQKNYQKILYLRSNYSKVAAYKMHIPKSITFLYNSKQVEFETQNTILFLLALQN